jgi:hypothetical protein
VPTLLSRLVSPSGFVLAGLLLLLPFVGVSCSDAELGTMDGSYTGFDLVSGGGPGYDSDGPVGDMVAIEQVEFPEPGAQVLAIPLVVLLLAGVAAALLPMVRVRAVTAAAIAATAAVLLVVIQVAAQSNLVTSMQELLLVNLSTVPQDLERIATSDYLSQATGTRIGFWLSLIALLGVAAVNVVILMRARTPARQQ